MTAREEQRAMALNLVPARRSRQQAARVLDLSEQRRRAGTVCNAYPVGST